MSVVPLKCPHCGKALAVVESERFGSVTAHESPLCGEAQKLAQKNDPPTVAITFVFVGLVPPQGMPRCTHRESCRLDKGHRGVCRVDAA